ncbi:DUF1702 family protein [Ktedonospora formicarum]|nr:DUF1702 family protein [Ktedonospora formicarum]
MGKISRTLFGIPSERAVFSRPGFAPEAWTRFQPVAHSLVEGYHATLEDSRFEKLVPRLTAFAPELHGFAYEGAGMGIAALDIIAPWKDRLTAFIDGPAGPHIYPTYVGVGLALARLHKDPEKYLTRLDPLLGWVVADGYGFHEGFFRRRKYVDQRAVPTHLSPYARRLFDQGLGRCIWFSSGGLVDLVTSIVTAYPRERHADIWSGVGTACAYAGGATREEVENLLEIAHPYRSLLASGAAVASQGRLRAGNMAEHTEMACQIFGRLTARQAADVANSAQENLPFNMHKPAYEIWHERMQEHFSALSLR